MRRKDREIKGPADILAIIEAADSCRLAMVDDRRDKPMPYLVAMNFGFEPGPADILAGTFWFHCAKEGLKLDLLRRQPATQPPLRVLLSARDERLPKALVQAGTAGVIGVGVAPLRITFRRRCVHACRVYSASSPAISLNALS